MCKKLAAWGLAICLLLTLGACGKDTSPTETVSSTASETIAAASSAPETEPDATAVDSTDAAPSASNDSETEPDVTEGAPVPSDIPKTEPDTTGGAPAPAKGSAAQGSAAQPHSTAPTQAPTQPPTDSRTTILIAYFSWSGNTKQLAETIRDQTGGDLFEIAPATPYTNDINKLSGIALQEQRTNARPALAAHVDNMDQYDVIFVGYPNWWNDMPMPVFTFLEEYDFAGKTVIPFTTYGDGVFGRSVTSLKNTLPQSAIPDGLAVQEHTLETAPQRVSEWLRQLGIGK